MKNLQTSDKRGELHERRLPALPHLPHARLYILGRAFHEIRELLTQKKGSLSNVVVTLDRMYPIGCISMPPYRPVVVSFVALSAPDHSKGTEFCA